MFRTAPRLLSLYSGCHIESCFKKGRNGFSKLYRPPRDIDLIFFTWYPRNTFVLFLSELNSKFKESERAKRLVMRDKDYLENEVTSLRSKVSSLQKEMKEIQGQEKKSINEFSDLNDKLAEVRSQKMKLSRLVREKEEEIESAMRKVETLRKDFRSSERQRHAMVVKLEEAQADKEREAKLRAKADLYSQQLEEEVDSIKMRTPSPAPAPLRRGSDADVVKLRVELEKVKLESEEKLSRERKRVNSENNVSEAAHIFLKETQ